MRKSIHRNPSSRTNCTFKERWGKKRPVNERLIGHKSDSTFPDQRRRACIKLYKTVYTLLTTFVLKGP